MSSKINIEQLEEYLKQAGLENGKLEEVLSPIKELNNQRRYGLVWEEPDNTTYGSDSAEQELLKNFPFLKEVNEHRIFNGEQHPDHLLIEGDNLHALKTMQYTHKNKIDVIYIDPPYNTGNTDFVYNDKYVDSEDSWRHSKWLSFMNKRLRLARELMTDEGVIFISIDDNEYAQLKLLCDQIFGEENFISNLIWLNNKKGRQTDKNIAGQHEYILMYAKDAKRFNIKDEEYKGDNLEEEYNLEDEISKYKRGVELTNTNSKFNIKTRPNLFYSVYYNENTGEAITVDEKEDIGEGVHEPKEEFINKGYIRILPRYREGKGYGCWRWGMEKFNKEYKDEIMFETNKEGVYNLYTKLRLDRNGVKILKHKSVIDITGTGIRNKLNEIIDSEFDFPKPLRLIEKLVSMHPNKNATVLDFFAGSGTTAHSVMELNKEDGGNRQAIVITNNEINDAEEERLLVEKGYVEPFTGTQKGTKKHAEWLEKVNDFKETPEYKEFIQTDEYKDLGIARAVTEQRINKVINGYTTPKGKEVAGLTDNNFYHFEVVLEPDLMDMDLNTYVLVKKTKDIIRIKEGVYTTEEDISTETTPAVKLVNDEKEVIVVLSVRVTESDIYQLINNFTGSDKENIIYTSYTGYDYDLHSVNFKELPKELLHAIKHNDNN